MHNFESPPTRLSTLLSTTCAHFIRQPGQAAPAAPASSPFASMATAKPGFVFGAAATPTSNFSLGSGSAPTAVAAAPGGFSFLNNAPVVSPAAESKPLVPAQPAAVESQPVSSSAPEGGPASTAVDSALQGGAFGEGRTAARGGRLNERFTSWLSHQLSEDAASFLDSGLRDYVAFAAEIRERADFSRAEPAPNTTFRHPSETTAFTSSPRTIPKQSETGPAAAASILEPPPVAATPVTAPSPVAKPAPAFSFSAPSTLPPAPRGQQFSFATTSSALGGPKFDAPSTTSSPGGFKFGGGLGAVGASPGAFNGEMFTSSCRCFLHGNCSASPMAGRPGGLVGIFVTFWHPDHGFESRREWFFSHFRIWG